MENFSKSRDKLISNYVCLILKQEVRETIHCYYSVLLEPQTSLKSSSGFSFILTVPGESRETSLQ